MSETKKENWLPNNLEIAGDEVLYFGTMYHAVEFMDTASKYVEAIQSYDRSRLIVLETWLLLDYSIRHLILSGLGLSKHETEDFDLKDNLLPRSFRYCLNFLIRLRDHNQNLPSPNSEYPIKTSLDFISFLREKDEETANKLEKIIQEYCESKSIPSVDENFNVNERFVDDKWLKVVNKIDQAWKQKAERINAARNVAAHSYEDKLVAKKLGFNGKTAVSQVRKYCLQTFEELLGIKPIDKNA